LWQYEDLIAKLTALKVFPFLWHIYNQDLTQAAAFARCLFATNNIANNEYPASILSTIEELQSAGVLNWGDLLSRVRTRIECVQFLGENLLYFEEFINVLNYLLRWGFPFKTSSRELLDHDDPQEMETHATLKQYRLMTSFDILESGRTLEGRRILVEKTGLSFEWITTLVHRADIARLPYVRRKTILPVCAAGYDTLAKIAAANLDQMDFDMNIYFSRKQGKPWENYKAVIVLKLLVNCARALPVIVKD
jgi:hypothetical protein